MERDDIIEYSLDAHHSEEEGVKKRKKIVKVTLLLSAITAVEIIVGLVAGKRHVSETVWEIVKWSYIVLTIVKAAYIVLSFMHLGDERKSFKWTILLPYLIFMAYLIFIALSEATAVDAHNYNEYIPWNKK
jgi:cytochrome c oxidase subunit IV